MSTTQTTWKGLTQGKGVIEDTTLSIPIAIPEVFGGNGNGANPKDLLKASAVSCYVMTLAIMLQSRKIPVDDIRVTSEIFGDKPANLHISHSVELSLAPEATPEQVQSAQTLITAADSACMIGNLLKAGGAQVSVSGNAVQAQ